MYGTVVEVHPSTTELIPGSQDDTMFQRIQNPDASLYTATHAAVSVPASEEQIRAIAARENWQMRHRVSLFKVIGLWIENHVLIELLPPTIAPGHLAFMQPQILKQFFTAKATSTEQKTSHQSATKRVYNENSSV